MDSLRALVRSILLEDRRGRVRALGFTPEFADHLHNFRPPYSHKYSSWMAKQVLEIHGHLIKATLNQRKTADWRELEKTFHLKPAGNPELPPEGVVEPGTKVQAVNGPKGTYVGITPGWTVAVRWDDSKGGTWEQMLDRLDQQWKKKIEKDLRQYLTRVIPGSFSRTNPSGQSLEEFFNKTFDWLEASGGGANLNKMSYEDISDRLAERGRLAQSEEEGSVFMTFDDGFYWIDLAKRKCSYEARHMGHCGDAAAYGNLWSLRDKHGKPHVTATIKGGDLYEMRGKENTKPVKKYHKYIVPLLAKPRITDIKVNDVRGFQLSDLSDNARKWLLSKKPQWSDALAMSE